MIRRLNWRGATRDPCRMREHLTGAMGRRFDLGPVDPPICSFVRILVQSRIFVLRRIEWSTLRSSSKKISATKRADSIVVDLRCWSSISARQS